MIFMTRDKLGFMLVLLRALYTTSYPRTFLRLPLFWTY